MKKVLIITNNLECDELVGYFSTLERYFLRNGWESTNSFDADLIIIAACGAIDQVYEQVQNALKDILSIKGNFNSTVIMGCQVVTYRDKLRSIYNGKMISYGQESILDNLICANYKFESVNTPNVFNSPRQTKNELFTIIISTGCLQKCTYCIIKEAHGRIKSKTIEQISDEFSLAVNSGFKHIALAGTDTSVYGYDINTNIIELIKKLRNIDSTVKFYIDNLHPHNLIKYYDDFIELAKQNAFAYLHIAFQHVDNDILKRMGRKADFEEVYTMIRRMKHECPSLIIFTDFIFAFPGESEQQFDKLLSFVKNDKLFDYYYIHDYCDIPGTASYNLSNKISDDTKKERGLKLTVAFERRKEEKINQMDSDNYRIFKHRYDIESELEKDNPKGYYFCKDTFVELEPMY